MGASSVGDVASCREAKGGSWREERGARSCDSWVKVQPLRCSGVGVAAGFVEADAEGESCGESDSEISDGGDWRGGESGSEETGGELSGAGAGEELSCGGSGDDDSGGGELEGEDSGDEWSREEAGVSEYGGE